MPYLAFLLACLLAPLAGCIDPVNCTAIGCSDQLTVQLQHGQAQPYQVTLTVDGKPASFTCTASGVRDATGVTVERCDGASFVLVGAPVSVTVKVACGLGPDDAGVLICTGTFTPTYTTSQPNGPRCEPTCHQATVTLQ